MFKNWSFGEKSPNQKISTDQTSQVIFIFTFSFISHHRAIGRKSSILFVGDKTVKVARKAGEGGFTWDSAQAGKSFMQARGVDISLVGTAIPQTVLHLLRSEVWKYKNKNKLKMTKYKCKIQNC